MCGSLFPNHQRATDTPQNVFCGLMEMNITCCAIMLSLSMQSQTLLTWATCGWLAVVGMTGSTELNLPRVMLVDVQLLEKPAAHLCFQS